MLSAVPIQGRSGTAAAPDPTDKHPTYPSFAELLRVPPSYISAKHAFRRVQNALILLKHQHYVKKFLELIVFGNTS